MKYLTSLHVLGFGFLLAGCLTGCLWPGGCPPTESKFESWERHLQITDTHNYFHDVRHPLDPSPSPEPYQGFFNVYDSYRYETDKTVASTVPRKIALTFFVQYTGDAVRSWAEDGLFGSDSTRWNANHVGYVFHDMNLELDSLVEGTYVLQANDTTGPKRVNVRLQTWGDSTLATPALSLSALSGSITILQRFTRNSGKFSYVLDATYRPGQTSHFEGTVVFTGVAHIEKCEFGGVP